MIKIGSHVKMGGKDMLLGSAKEAVSYGANTFMVYTGAPQNTKRKAISELNIDTAWEYMKQNGIEAAVIGKITDGNNRIIHNTEEDRYLGLPEQDEIYRFI